MNSLLKLLCFGLALTPLFAGDDPVADGKLPRNVLSNEGVVVLAEAGYDEAFLSDLILHKQTHFDTTVEGLAFLAHHGLSDRVVRLMIANENKPPRPYVEAAPSANPPTVVRARVVRQKMLVPDTGKKSRKKTEAPAEPTGLIAPAHAAGQAPYVMSIGRSWFLVNPSPTALGAPVEPIPIPR